MAPRYLRLQEEAAEINPSAIEMARTAHFINLPLAERKHSIQRAVALAEACIHPFTWDLFSYQNHEQPPQQQFDDAIETSFVDMLRQAEEQPYVYNLLTNTIIRFMSYDTPRSETDFLRALHEHAAIVRNLPYSMRECKAFHADARAIPLPDASVDLIITSPPYINVFNYHQNNRSAMELIGWDLLDIAKSEIGSNRKNRQNRFLTVVQYTLDMLDVLKEMRRLLQPDGRAIIVMGRESNVRGLSFKNGLLVAALASDGSGFHLETRQERKFKNKFGEIIYEDILHLVPVSVSNIADDSLAHSLARWSLLEASTNADGEIRNEVLSASERATSVQKSPLFRPTVERYQTAAVIKEENMPYEVRGIAMKPYPTPHLDKLKATLVNDKLPPGDKPQVEKAIEHYEQWIANMEITMEADIAPNERLERMVSLLNTYRNHKELARISGITSAHIKDARKQGNLTLSFLMTILTGLRFSSDFSNIFVSFSGTKLLMNKPYWNADTSNATLRHPKPLKQKRPDIAALLNQLCSGFAKSVTSFHFDA